jgi:DnaJ-class molecular chaperone
MIEILQQCSVCHGTKLLDMSDEVACERCDANGYVHVGKLDTDDLEDKINGILNKCNDIFEKVNV